MKKRETKDRGRKLTLARETLLRLQDETLFDVEGAKGPPTGDCGSVNTFCASCLCPIK